MPSLWHLMRPVALAALIVTLIFTLAVPASLAQDGETRVLIQGSQQLEDVLRTIRDRYLESAPDADVQIDPQGPSRGFDALCRGEADIVMATEPISDALIARCAEQGQDFIETVITYQAVVILAPAAAGLTCLTQDQIEKTWSLGAPTDLTWADLETVTLSGTLSYVGPQDFSPAYTLFRALLPAGELRDDIQTFDNPQAIADAVASADAPALGFVSLADYEALPPSGAVAVSIANSAGECVPPGLNTLEDRSYPLAQYGYLYVNANSAQREPVRRFLEFALTDEAGAQTAAPEHGFLSPTAATLSLGLNNVLNGTVGRSFTRPLSPVNIATTEAGTITVAGTSLFSGLTEDIANSFTGRFTQAQVKTETLGEAAGWQALCSGEADVLQTTRDATDEERALCEENRLDLHTIDLGYEAVVFAVPASNDWLQCLDGETFEAIFAAATDDSPASESWDAINADWPESDLLLVVPPLSTGETDFVAFRLLGRLDFVMRDDVVTSNDPLYRAQGVANTDNGLTYLRWSALQGSQADVNLLAVDAGEGCVAPSPETFADGSYALAYPVRYTFTTGSLARPLVRAFFWQFYDQTTIERLSETPFAGLDLARWAGDERSAAFDFLAAFEPAPSEEPSEATEEPVDEPEAEPEATETPDAAGEPEVTPTPSNN